MNHFSFTFSYDRDGHIAWLALDGYLDGPAARRLGRVLHAAVAGLAPRKLLVDARDLTHYDGASVYRLFRTGAAVDREACDIVLVTRGMVRVLVA